MGFYSQRASLVVPVRVAGDYGGERWSYDPADGATVQPIPFGVDIQPRFAETTVEGRTRRTVAIGLRLFTPPGRDLQVPDGAMVRFRGKDYPLAGEPNVWPSGSFASGVDHVTLDLERTDG